MAFSVSDPERTDIVIPKRTDGPDAVIEYLQFIHEHPEIHIGDKELDVAIYGQPNVDSEHALESEYTREGLDTRFRSEKSWFPGSSIIWTPYDTIRSVIRAFDPSKDDTFYDLGAGYGRSVLYAAATTRATCKGVELFDERVKLANESKARLGLDNVLMIEGNVTESDFSDGDIFYMFWPFTDSTLSKVVLQLETIANDKQISIVARGGTTFFEKLPWLTEAETITTRKPYITNSVYMDTVHVFESN